MESEENITVTNNSTTRFTAGGYHKSKTQFDRKMRIADCITPA